jgi:LysM repeat protein
MEKRPLPRRAAWVIVAIVHVGIVLLWVSMGGCGPSSTREVDDHGTPAVVEPEDLNIQSDYETVEPEISVAETPAVVERTSTKTETVEVANEIRYVVQPGDSLWKISRTFGVTVNAIADRNDIQDTRLIRVGRELWIPNPTKGFDKATTEPATSTTSSTTTTTPTIGDTTVIEPTTGETTTTTVTEPVDLSTIETFDYEVQPGDTIWKLARTYHTTTTIIMELNGITDARTMRAGDTIRIPKPTGE